MTPRQRGRSLNPRTDQELTDRVADSAAALTGDHVLGGAGAVHLASALTLAEVDPVAATWDQRLWTAARDADLIVAPAALTT